MTEHSEELSRGSAHTDSEDDDDMSEKVTRKSRKKVGGIDLDEVEHTLRKAQHEREECVSAFNSIRNQSQGHSRKIHDLQVQFDEARVRIDKLLSRKSRSRSDYSSSAPLSPRTTRVSVSAEPSSVETSSTSHKVELTMNPKVKQPTFQAVTLTVKVDEDEESDE